MAWKRVEAAIDHYNARVEYRASCTGDARGVTARAAPGDRGETHAVRERERESEKEREKEGKRKRDIYRGPGRKRETDVALFRNFGVSR